MSGGSRVSIPNSARKTIQNIKEIAGNHSDEEIYAMLRECSMDPNETTQKLLLQDTFHEVRRKRDRRKENSNNREPADSRWRPGMQGRGGRGGRGNYSSRYVSHDASGGRNVSVGKEVNQGIDRGITTSSPDIRDTENSSVTGTINVPSKPAQVAPLGSTSQVPDGSVVTQVEGSLFADTIKPGSTAPPAVDVKSGPAPVIGISSGQSGPSSDQFVSSISPASASGVYASASDPVLVPSLDSRFHGIAGTIKREVGSQRSAVEPTINKVVSHDVAGSESSSSVSEKTASEVGVSHVHGKIPSKSQGYDVNHLSEAVQAVSSSPQADTSGGRPPSNYSSRSQQSIGPQKAVGPGKEWKPKPTIPNLAQTSGTTGTSDVAPTTAAEAIARPQPSVSSQVSDETTSKLQKKLEELQFSDGQHVIIPNHFQVPEAERTGLSFGSFDANFQLSTNIANGPDSEKSSTPLSESSQGFEENIEQPSLRIENASPTSQEEEYADHPQSPAKMPENLSSGEADISSSISAVPEYDQSKPETNLVPGGPQYSVVHTAPTYSSFGLMPPMLGNQFAPFESSESQARDGSRLPNFVVQQPFDPSASYYTQIYRPCADGDGRFSPFLPPGSATKFNGNIAMVSAQTGQSPQESGNSVVLPTTSPTPLITQAAGAMQSSLAVTQQPVPVFRQPTGVHLPHYPPNYIPYGQYFPPFYVSPPIHHFLSNSAFPQQPPPGSMYPLPAAAAATPVKYSLSQYKPGSNSGSSIHAAMPTAYGSYSSSPTSYSPGPAVTTRSSTGNEDLTASQYKENSVYMSGQQSEGSAVWIPAPGRGDIPGMQASSFYNLPPQGQHVSFTPTQAGHGAFTGIYHPNQTVAASPVHHPLLQPSQTMSGAVEMVGPPAGGVYQQPQRAQVNNWANNY